MNTIGTFLFVLSSLGMAVSAASAQQGQETQGQVAEQDRENLQVLMLEFDEDSDMTLSQEEFETFWNEHLQPGQGQAGQSARQLFTEIDMDENGMVSAEELISSNEVLDHLSSPGEQAAASSGANSEAGGSSLLEEMALAEPARLRGESIYSSQDELLGIGEIQEIVRSRSGNELHAVVSSEELLEIDDMAAVPLSEFQWQDGKVIYSGSEAEFEALFEQPYQEAQYEPVDQAGNQQAGI